MHQQDDPAATGKFSIEIQVDGVTYVAHERSLAGAAIKALAHKPPGNLLYRVEERRRIEVSDTEIVHLHEDEKFVTQPPVGGTS